MKDKPIEQRRAKKSKRSTRNRHTGHVNAFKQMVRDRGRLIGMTGRDYYAAQVGKWGKYTLVRA